MSVESEIMQRVDTLPAWPVAVSRLLRLVNDDGSTNEQIAEVLRLDAGLTANVLRLANSPLFGLRRSIADVDHATSILGRRRLLELAIAGAFSKTIPTRLAGYGMEGALFWLHSVAVATLSAALSRRVGLDDPQATFTAGLLHDCGKLAVSDVLERKHDEVRFNLEATPSRFVDVETHVTGTDHSVVGATILEKWGLPRNIVLAAQHHHDPSGVEDRSERASVDVVHVANAVAQSMGHGADLGSLASDLSMASLERLELAEEHLELAMVESHDSIQHFGSIL